MKIRIIHKDGSEQSLKTNPHEELFNTFYVRGPYNIKEGKKDICSYCEREGANTSYKFKHNSSFLFYNFCNEDCLAEYLKEIRPDTLITTPLMRRFSSVTNLSDKYLDESYNDSECESPVPLRKKIDSMSYEDVLRMFSKYKTNVAVVL